MLSQQLVNTIANQRMQKLRPFADVLPEILTGDYLGRMEHETFEAFFQQVLHTHRLTELIKKEKMKVADKSEDKRNLENYAYCHLMEIAKFIPAMTQPEAKIIAMGIVDKLSEIQVYILNQTKNL